MAGLPRKYKTYKMCKMCKLYKRLRKDLYIETRMLRCIHLHMVQYKRMCRARLCKPAYILRYRRIHT